MRHALVTPLTRYFTANTKLMDKGLKYWFRWIAVLPGALIAGLLSTFLLRLILVQTLKNFVEPYPEFPERALTPFAIALTFVWVGCEIAPEHKYKTGILLFSMWMFLAGGFIFLTLTGGTWFGKNLYLQGGGFAPIMGIVGAFTGLYIVRKKFTERVDGDIK